VCAQMLNFGTCNTSSSIIDITWLVSHDTSSASLLLWSTLDRFFFSTFPQTDDSAVSRWM